jgi:hypothetical protein
MKKIIFFLLGLLLPIFIVTLIENSFNSASMVWPLVLIFNSTLLLFVVCLPLIVWAIVATIYGYKNKPIIYSYTIGMVIGIALVFNLYTLINYFKYNWGLGM